MTIEIPTEDASRVAGWLRTRGGVARWALLTAPGEVFTPALTEEGQPMPRPSWRHSEAPVGIVTDAQDVLVIERIKVEAFHVAVQRGDALQIVLTKAASGKLQRALAKAGEDAWYEFDYGAYENCVIFKPGSKTPLPALLLPA